MTDPAPKTQPIVTAKAPDVTNDASYQNQAVALGAYAQNAFNGVLAQYRFMGLIAGIKGPNDTDQDVTNARNAIMEALSDFFSIKDGPLDTALAESYHKYLEMRDRNIYDQFPTDEALWVQDLVTRVGRMGHPLDLASYTREYANGSRRPDLSQYLSSGAISAKGAAYINKAADHYQKAAQYAQQMRDIRAEKRRQWWSDLWSSIKNYYNDKMELIGKGQWLLAAGKVSIDIAVVAAEEVIVGGIIAGVIAITGGLAAAAVLALRAGVRAAISVVRLGTRTVRRVTATYRFRIELTKVSPNTLFSNPSPIAIKVERKLPYRKDIDVAKDLTAAERKAMGEGGQGSTRPDADAPESGKSGGANVNDPPPYRHPRDGKPPRSRDELLPNGKVPTASSGRFNSWWDDLSPDELDSLWTDATIRKQIKRQVREPGGMHEWLMVAEGPRLKRMGFNMDEIKAMTSPTRTLEGPYPNGARGERWRHSREDGGRGAGPNSGKMHGSLRDTIKSASNRNDLLRNLRTWSRDWLDGGPDGFPTALRDAIKNAPN